MASSSSIARSRFLALDRGLDPAHQQVGGVAAGSEPERPDAVLDRLGAVGVGRGLQRLEQEIEIFDAVAARRARQFARRPSCPGCGAAAGQTPPSGRAAPQRGRRKSWSREATWSASYGPDAAAQ